MKADREADREATVVGALMLGALVGAVLLILAAAVFADQQYPGISPEVTYCFEDQNGDFYGMWAYSPPGSGQLLVSGHKHDTRFAPEDSCWLQPFTGSGYLWNSPTIASVGLRLIGGTGYCLGRDIRLFFNYDVEPWTATGFISDTGNEISLTRVDCSSSHPQGRPASWE